MGLSDYKSPEYMVLRPELDRVALSHAIRGLSMKPIPPSFYEKENISYAAGKLEGEGWVTWFRKTGRPFVLQIGIGATDRKQIERVASLWNVGVSKRIEKRKLRWRTMYLAYATGLRDYRILEAITPFLTSDSPKRKRAEWAVSYGFMIAEYEHSEFLKLYGRKG